MPDANVKSGANAPGPSAQPGQNMPPPTITKKTPATASRATTKGGAQRRPFLKAAGFLVWSGFMFLFKWNWTALRFLLWSIPSRIYHAFRRIKSNKLRRAAALGAGLLIGIGVFFLWPVAKESVSAVGPTRNGAGTESPSTNQVMCEFFARPAAKLFIDGEIASPEVPPIFRTPLEVGEHSIRFVSPDGRSREETIEVRKGEPTQWFMNFINDSLDERELAP